MDTESDTHRASWMLAGWPAKWPVSPCPLCAVWQQCQNSLTASAPRHWRLMQSPGDSAARCRIAAPDEAGRLSLIRCGFRSCRASIR